MFSLFADVIKGFLPRLSALGCRLSANNQESAVRSRKPRAESRKPRLEALEDRCLPSVTTTVPAVTDMMPSLAMLDMFFAMTPKGNPTAVFLGDSISWGYAYGEGAAVWDVYMAPLGMADYGVGGQTTQTLLFQISMGQLVGIDPAAVVLEIGANNLLQGNSVQDTVAGILADVSAIQAYLPQTQVVVLGVLPGSQYPLDWYRIEGEQVDQLVAQQLAGNPHVTVLDLNSIFQQPDGIISNALLFDYLHPTAWGYGELTNALLPVLDPILFGTNFTVPTIPAGPYTLTSLALIGA